MFYSDSVRYALMALSYLAKNRDRMVKVEEIAKAKNIPKPFLAKILNELAKGDVLISLKGPAGGFKLKKDPSEVSIWDVVEIMREDNKFYMCILMPDKCEIYETNPCVVHHLWEGIKSQMIEFMKRTTLVDLID